MPTYRFCSVETDLAIVTSLSLLLFPSPSGNEPLRSKTEAVKRPFIDSSVCLSSHPFEDGVNNSLNKCLSKFGNSVNQLVSCLQLINSVIVRSAMLNWPIVMIVLCALLVLALPVYNKHCVAQVIIKCGH